MRYLPQALLCFSIFVGCVTPSLAGTWTQVTTLPTGVIDNGTGSGGPGGASGTQTSNGTVVSFGCHVTGSASITFTWVPASGQDSSTDPPPLNVVVSETAGATAACGITGTSTTPPGPPPSACFVPTEVDESSDLLPDVDDVFPEVAFSVPAGLPSLEAPTECGLFQTVEIGSSTASCSVGSWGTDVSSSNSSGGCTCVVSGNHWEVKDSSSGSFTVTSPTLSATVSGNCYWYATMQANVYFTAGEADVAINPSGTTSDSNGKLYILTGQGIDATLSTGGYPVVAGSYQWNASGAIFNYFSPTSNQSGPISHGGEVPFPDSDYHQADFKFYTKDDDVIIVYCTANVQLPDGTNPSVTATSKDIRSIKPTANWVVSSSGVRFSTGFATGPTSAPGAFGPFTPANGNASGDNGQDWIATITIGAPFANTSAQGAFCQLARPDLFFYVASPTGPPYRFTINNNALEGLDGSFPYNPPGGSLAQWTLPEQGISGDSPSTPADPTYKQVFVSESFDTWLLFLPTGGAGLPSWVPLQQYAWSWGATANQAQDGSGNWNNVWSLSNILGALPAPYPYNTTTFPDWTFIPQPNVLIPDNGYTP